MNEITDMRTSLNTVLAHVGPGAVSRLRESPETAALYTALAQSQAAFTNPDKDQTVTVRPKDGGPSYTFSFASFASIMKMVRGPLGAHNLVVIQPPCRDDSGKMCLLTKLIHGPSAQWLECELPLPSADKMQTMGSNISFLRRYSLSALLGIVGDEEDDANIASGNEVQAHDFPAIADGHTENVTKTLRRLARGCCDPGDISELFSYWLQHASGFEAYRGKELWSYVEDLMRTAISGVMGKQIATIFVSAMRVSDVAQLNVMETYTNGTWKPTLDLLAAQIPDVHEKLLAHIKLNTVRVERAAAKLQAPKAIEAAPKAIEPPPEAPPPEPQNIEPPGFLFVLHDQFGGDDAQACPGPLEFIRQYLDVRKKVSEQEHDAYDQHNADALDEALRDPAARAVYNEAMTPPRADRDLLVTTSVGAGNQVTNVAVYLQALYASIEALLGSDITRWIDLNRPVYSKLSSLMQAKIAQKLILRRATLGLPAMGPT